MRSVQPGSGKCRQAVAKSAGLCEPSVLSGRARTCKLGERAGPLRLAVDEAEDLRDLDARVLGAARAQAARHGGDDLLGAVVVACRRARARCTRLVKLVRPGSRQDVRRVAHLGVEDVLLGLPRHKAPCEVLDGRELALHERDEEDELVDHRRKRLLLHARTRYELAEFVYVVSARLDSRGRLRW